MMIGQRSSCVETLIFSILNDPAKPRGNSSGDPIELPFEFGGPHLVINEYREIDNILRGEPYRLIKQELLPGSDSFMDVMAVSTRPGQVRIFYFKLKG